MPLDYVASHLMLISFPPTSPYMQILKIHAATLTPNTMQRNIFVSKIVNFYRPKDNSSTTLLCSDNDSAAPWG